MAHFLGGLKGKRYRRGRHIIWMHAVVWVLWLRYNNVIFQGGVVDFISVIAPIKILSWNWFNMLID